MVNLIKNNLELLETRSSITSVFVRHQSTDLKRSSSQGTSRHVIIFWSSYACQMWILFVRDAQIQRTNITTYRRTLNSTWATTCTRERTIHSILSNTSLRPISILTMCPATSPSMIFDTFTKLGNTNHRSGLTTHVKCKSSMI